MRDWWVGWRWRKGPQQEGYLEEVVSEVPQGTAAAQQGGEEFWAHAGSIISCVTEEPWVWWNGRLGAVYTLVTVSPPSRASLCSPFFLAAEPPPLLHSGTCLSALLPPLRLHCQHASLQGHEKLPLLTKGWGALVFGGRSRSRMTVWDQPALEWNHPSKVYLSRGQGPGIHHHARILMGSLSFRVPWCLAVLTVDRGIIAIKVPVYKKRVEVVLLWMQDTLLPIKATWPRVTQGYCESDEQQVSPLNMTPGSNFLGLFPAPCGRQVSTSTLPLLLVI
jgi:hypothetical protein